MKLYINLKMKCQVNLINFVKVYNSGILYGKQNQKSNYLKSHSRTSNPQINSSEQHLSFPKGEGKGISQR